MTHSSGLREFYRDTSYRSLGEQYNNLGNIVQGSSGIWPGQKGIGWDGGNKRAYKAFATVEDGIAAQAFLLERYVNQKGDRTFGDIISRYAPSSDGNNVGAYTAHVADRVDAIARGLGYKGAKIGGNTDLQKAFADKEAGDILLAATVQAMDEVEVGKIVSPSTTLGAVKDIYRKKIGGYDGFMHAIGEDPGVRAPGKTHTGTAEIENPDYDTDATTDPKKKKSKPNDAAIDAVGADMMQQFVTALSDLLKSIFTSLFGGVSGAVSPPSPAPAPAADLDVASLVPADMLKQLGVRAQYVFDVDYNGHVNQQDVVAIQNQLKTSGVSLAANAGAAEVLTAYALQLVNPPVPALMKR